MSNTDKNRLYRLWSVIAFGAGTRLLADITARFDSAEEMYIAMTSDEDIRKEMPANAVKAADETPLSNAEKIAEYCLERNIGIICCDDEAYPQRLRTIYAPPPVLFYKGCISGLDDRLSIGIVGTRKPSDYSLKVTSGIVKILANHNFDIISGFAEGIDIRAHMTAVKSGSRTFAVLGCGIDCNYPRNNMQYRDYIIENGAVITEYLPSAQPFPSNFPHRNRILAGLSLGIAVIEAGAQSGSLNSASHAASQGKPVFCVPPCDLFDKRYKGNVELIREGAIVLMGARDIYNEYCLNVPHTITDNAAISQKLSELKTISDNAEKADREKAHETKAAEAPRSESKAVKDEKNKPAKESIGHILTEDEINAAENDIQRAVLTCINGAPKRADEIAEELAEENIDDILAALTELEIYGTVANDSGIYKII